MPKLTRRTFVSALGAGVCTFPLFPRPLRAAAAKLPEMSFSVVSDTHLGYRDEEHAAAQWRKTAAELARAGGDFVLHLGDVVDGGREAQYAVYVDIRKQITQKVYEIPGNHDPQPLFEKHIRRPVELAVEHKWLRVLLLNNSRRDSHDGFLTREQLAWLAEQCAAAARAEQYVILGMHVPAHDNKHPDRGWHVKPADGQTELDKLLREPANRVLALFHGHFHNGLRGWDDRASVHEIVFPSALYNQDRKLSEQKAPGYNLAEFRPGYTAVAIKDGLLTLRYQPVGADKPAVKECRLERLAT